MLPTSQNVGFGDASSGDGVGMGEILVSVALGRGLCASIGS